MGKLLVAVARVLPFCAVLLVLPALVAAQEVDRLFIDRVWTTDTNGNDKTTFLPGDEIHYVTLIRNTYNHPVKMRIRFEASGPRWPLMQVVNPAFRDIYLYEQQDVNVPVGLSSYYSPWTIPNSAQPGLYVADIHVQWHSGPHAGSYTGTGNFGLFSIPGTLATDITTFLSDGVTPTSAVGEAGPGEAVFYKITVTNTSSENNTNVVLTDPLPPEIFDIIGTATTDHGTCSKTGFWPSTITCQLGSLASHETATIYFTASINVRHPSGEPRPPGNFVNKVYVRSDQQRYETSASVKTLVTTQELTDAEALAFLDAAAGCVTLVPAIGPLAGWVWEMIGRDLATGQPEPYREKFVQAADLASKELLVEILEEGAGQVGLPEKIVSPTVDSVECIAGFRAFLARY